MMQELTLISKEVRFPDSAPAAYPVFFRTYSRKYNNKRESWAEVCDRTLISSGFAKAYSMTGWRDRKLIREQTELQIAC